jgi:hypothetical protein
MSCRKLADGPYQGGAKAADAFALPQFHLELACSSVPG